MSTEFIVLIIFFPHTQLYPLSHRARKGIWPWHQIEGNTRTYTIHTLVFQYHKIGGSTVAFRTWNFDRLRGGLRNKVSGHAHTHSNSHKYGQSQSGQSDIISKSLSVAFMHSFFEFSLKLFLFIGNKNSGWHCFRFFSPTIWFSKRSVWFSPPFSQGKNTPSLSGKDLLVMAVHALT